MPRRFQFGRQPHISCAFGTQLLRSWATRCEALSLIHFLVAEDKLNIERLPAALRALNELLVGPDQQRAAWLDALSSDQTLSEPVRQRALQFARDWK